LPAHFRREFSQHEHSNPAHFNKELPMSVRRVTKTVVTSTAAVAMAGLGALAFTGTAGAAATQISNAIVPQSPFTAGLPFDSGQLVDVAITGGYLPADSDVSIFECAAPNGVLPTSTTQCDGNSGYKGGTITTEGDGSFDLTSDTAFGTLYTMYALPDFHDLGETGASAAHCGLGAANECVLYIGTGGGSDVGMALPHVFSQVFNVGPDATDSGTVNPGDGTPEVPLAVGLPLLAGGIFGGTVLIRRRRAARTA
jgi:hypothetical protein